MCPPLSAEPISICVVVDLNSPETGPKIPISKLRLPIVVSQIEVPVLYQAVD